MKLIGSGCRFVWHDVGNLERYAIRGDARVFIKTGEDKWEVDPDKRVVGYHLGCIPIVADKEGNIINPEFAHQG